MKVTLRELKSIVRSVLSEVVCPKCGSDDPDNYVGLNDVECVNPKCKNHKPGLKRVPTKVVAEVGWDGYSRFVIIRKKKFVPYDLAHAKNPDFKRLYMSENVTEAQAGERMLDAAWMEILKANGVTHVVDPDIFENDMPWAEHTVEEFVARTMHL